MATRGKGDDNTDASCKYRLKPEWGKAEYNTQQDMGEDYLYDIVLGYPKISISWVTSERRLIRIWMNASVRLVGEILKSSGLQLRYSASFSAGQIALPTLGKVVKAIEAKLEAKIKSLGA